MPFSLAATLALSLVAQAPDAGSTSARAGDAVVAAPAQAAAPAPTEPAGPVPVPEPSEKALRYHRSGNVVWAVDTLLGLLVPGLFLFTGLSARLRDAAAKVGRRWYPTLVVYFVLFSILTWAISLPWAYYTEFVREHAYGLSNQTLSKWLGDGLKGLAVGLVMGALFVWVPFLLLRKSPRRWWLYTSLFSVPLIVFVLLVSPVFIAPLFNKFGPMKDKALEHDILALATRAGIEGGRVYEVDKSVDTKAVNAYVTGFGRTKRIVLWDTIIARLTKRELLFVMGHEMGHYVLGHVWKSILAASTLILVTLYLAHLTAGFFLRRFAGRFGFRELSDFAALPLLILLANVFSFAVSPALLAWSRHQEHEADRFGLEITRDNHAAATAFVKLQQENLGVPRPGLLYELWRSSHPPIGERIDFCNEYRPWESGAPGRYAPLFAAPPPGGR
jgi:STE24 endopeptidase